jgi:hypothetical protein
MIATDSGQAISCFSSKPQRDWPVDKAEISVTHQIYRSAYPFCDPDRFLALITMEAGQALKRLN